MSCPYYSMGMCSLNDHQQRLGYTTDEKTVSRYCVGDFRNCGYYTMEADKKAARADAERKAREAKEAAERAKAELRTAAEQGDADAQFNVGRLYFNGQEEIQDYAKAAEWFEKAAAQGHGEAKEFLVAAKAVIEKEKAREAKEAAERKAREAEMEREDAKEAAKETRHKIGNKIAPLLAVVSLIILFAGCVGKRDGLLLAIISTLIISIPFLVFYCSGKKWEHLIVKGFFLCLGAVLGFVMIRLVFNSRDGMEYIVIVPCMCIGFVSWITALIFPGER